MGALGAVPTGLVGSLLELDIRVSGELLQKVALLGKVRILRKELEADLFKVTECSLTSN